jgi:amidohydrolase
VQVDISDPVFDVLDQAFEEKTGSAAVTVRSGGSIPIVKELGQGGAPVILTGIGLPDDGLHSPNEKLDLQQLWDGIEIFGKFFELMAGQEPRAEDDDEEDDEVEEEAGSEGEDEAADHETLEV